MTYGGGHAPMIIPIVRELRNDPSISVECIALTTAGPRFSREGLPYRGFKDFISADDQDALACGLNLVREHHSADSGIDTQEAVAYLGLSYQDLVTRLGPETAATEWQDKGRHAFLPLTVIARIFDKVQPDVVIATNSPRAERAALMVANQRGIPTVALTDLFGIGQFYPIEAQHICVFSEIAIEHMLREGVTVPRGAFRVLGNPAFDAALDLRGPIDSERRANLLPGVPATSKALLWVDMPAYWNLDKGFLHVRSDADVVRDLDDLLAATQACDSWLLVRPHPSQHAEVHQTWVRQRGVGARVMFVGDLPLYPLLNSVNAVATYTSTVGVEALLMNRPVLQLKFHEGRSDMPLGELGLAWEVNDRADLPKQLSAVLTDGEAWKAKRERIKRILPEVRAAPRIADLIRETIR